MHKGNKGLKNEVGMYFGRIAEESDLTAMHIGLLMALYYHSDGAKFTNSFSASRSMLMRFSRIRSKATYHRCLRDLVAYGYLSYQPSWHPKKGSTFRFLSIENGTKGKYVVES